MRLLLASAVVSLLATDRSAMAPDDPPERRSGTAPVLEQARELAALLQR